MLLSLSLSLLDPPIDVVRPPANWLLSPYVVVVVVVLVLREKERGETKDDRQSIEKEGRKEGRKEVGSSIDATLDVGGDHSVLELLFGSELLKDQ